MLSITVHQLLELLEQQKPSANASVLLSTRQLRIATDGKFSIRNLQGNNYLHQPLSAIEQQQLRSLDRKAKGGWLSADENLLFEKLLEIQQYHAATAKTKAAA